MESLTQSTKPRSFFTPRVPQDFWEWILLRNDLRVAITKQGYFEVEKAEVSTLFKEWYGERRRICYRNNVEPREYRITSLSFDYYSQRPRVLDSNDLYTVPTGKGNCVIFDSNFFPPPNMKLNGLESHATTLPVRVRDGFRNLVDSLSAHWNEQTFLKALHFCNAFSILVDRICDAKSYECGSSGHITSSFPFWMKNAKRDKLIRFVYDGVVDLDECLYPKDKNVVIPIEAKIYNGHNGLSWHKLAFPAYRFVDNSSAFRTFRTGSSAIRSKVKVVPVYALFNPIIKSAFLYVFPQITLKQGARNDCLEYGIVLNERSQMVPEKVFKVRMDWLQD